MIKHRIFAAAGFLSALAVALAPIAMPPAAAAGSPADATAWIGHYPSETVRGIPGLLALPGLKRQLAALLGKADLKTLGSTYSVESPVVETDGFVVATVCMPHDCDAEAATLVVDPRTNDAAVGFITDDAGPRADQRQRRLYSSFDFARLPDAVARRLFTIPPPGA